MICIQCSSPFEVTAADRAFYDKISPVIAGQKCGIPDPTLCHDCRLQRRLVWRNERHLYHRTCSKTGQPLISWIAPDKPHPVYKKEIWWGDSWNALDYEHDVDFSKPFFPQLEALIKKVPFIDMLVDNAFNSDYANFCNNVKDCYLLYASNNDQNSHYSSYIWGCNDYMDCLQAFDCQFCYDCMDVNNCYNTSYSKNCTNVSDSYFCENCQNCQSCFGCVNLVGKKYHFMNQHRLKFPMRFAQIINCQDCTGDSLKNCKNVKEGYDSAGIEDCKWILIGGKPVKDCYDVTGAEVTELSYESVVTGIPTTHTYFSAYAWKNAHDILYSVLCPGSQNCFGVVGLKRGKHCILNKQYSKGDYETLVLKLIQHMRKTGEWGAFLPVNLSPFDYNETLANGYFSMSREDVLKRGWRWREKELKEYKPSEYKAPDSLADVKDDILQQVISCKECGKNYRLISQELVFYRIHQIPVPENCPDCRHTARMNRRNPRRLWSSACAKCAAPIQTTYPPERPEIVYCEACYLKEVY
ncbi:hypothetical protein HZA43_02075 [Candidatus Peregrinibacteria bacterium]|nr:hypothetical protein [Candidatus Peregrinibacteria bacterium]